MKKYLIPLIAGIFLTLAGCNKDEEGCGLPNPSGTASPSEVAHISNWLAGEGILNAIQLPSGVFVVINDAGDDRRAETCTKINFSYTGSFMDSTHHVFDSNPIGITVFLGQLVTGVQYALHEVGEGASVEIYLPPSLAYGSAGIVNNETGEIIVPPNTYLVFEVNLNEIQ
jgi:hypothetical protein